MFANFHSFQIILFEIFLGETDSHILPVTLPKRVHVQMDMDVENTPPASHMQQKEEKCGWGQNNDSNASTPKNKMARTNEEPKMSTPNCKCQFWNV